MPVRIFAAPELLVLQPEFSVEPLASSPASRPALGEAQRVGRLEQEKPPVLERVELRRPCLATAGEGEPVNLTGKGLRSGLKLRG
jgi:hypothetical protein